MWFYTKSIGIQVIYILISDESMIDTVLGKMYVDSQGQTINLYHFW